MNDLFELKRLVTAHAIAQNLPAERYTAVLDRITRDGGDGPGSWAFEWIRAGDEWDAAGQILTACQYYTLGRFPYVDGPGRARALDRAVRAFDRWRAAEQLIERRTIQVENQPVNVWTAGLSADRRRPLLVMSGGIVSPKEQWAALLPQIVSFGLAGVVVDYPGVGESPLRLRARSWRFFPTLLDALAAEADVANTYLLALSFSGHLALRAAGADHRIRGIVGNGPPVHHFFTDRAWWAQVPAVTRDTLAHLADVPATEVFDHMTDWAIDPRELRDLTIPVATVVAGRDEIIPASEAELLRATVRNLRLVEHDDVHGAPSHLAETRIWSLLAILEMWPGADPAARSALADAVSAARRSAGIGAAR